MSKKAKSITKKKIETTPTKESSRTKKKVEAKKAKTAVKKKVSPKKVKVSAKKNVKQVAVKKTKAVAKKKVKSPAKKIVKNVIKNKPKSIAVKTAKRLVKAKSVRPLTKKAKVSVQTRMKNVVKPAPVKVQKTVRKENVEKVKSPLVNAVLPEMKIHGDDLHFIPEHEQQKPITTIEVHAAENTFHHKDEVAFRQENKKVQQSIISQKNAKRFGRRTGRR